MASNSNSFLPHSRDSRGQPPLPESRSSFEGREYDYGYGAQISEEEFGYQSASQQLLMKSQFPELEVSSAAGTVTAHALMEAAVPWSAMRGALSEKDKVLRTLMRILNKLTSQKFDVLKHLLINSGINSADILLGVTSLIFDRAVSEPIFFPLYAKLCRDLSTVLPQFSSEDGKPVVFRRILLNTCQATFEGLVKMWVAMKEMTVTAPDQEAERHDKEKIVKLRCLGNIRFIGELFNQNMVSKRIVRRCVQQLLGHDENVEALCLLLNTVRKKCEENQLRAKQILALRRGTTNLSNGGGVMDNMGGGNNLGITVPGGLVPGMSRMGGSVGLCDGKLSAPPTVKIIESGSKEIIKMRSITSYFQHACDRSLRSGISRMQNTAGLFSGKSNAPVLNVKIIGSGSKEIMTGGLFSGKSSVPLSVKIIGSGSKKIMKPRLITAYFQSSHKNLMPATSICRVQDSGDLFAYKSCVTATESGLRKIIKTRLITSYFPPSETSRKRIPGQFPYLPDKSVKRHKAKDS